MKQEKENIIEVKHKYSSNGIIESTDYIVNGELVEGFYSLDSLRCCIKIRGRSQGVRLVASRSQSSGISLGKVHKEC